MVEITKKAHSIDGFAHPAPGGKVVPYLFIENADEDENESKPYYKEEKDQLQEKQEEEVGEVTINQVF